MADPVKPSRKSPPPDIASPPDSPKLKGKAFKEEEPADINIPDNYVQWTLRRAKPRPPLSWNNFWSELNYISIAVLTITPSIAIWGIMNVPLQWKTFLFSVLYYFITGLGITAGKSTSLIFLCQRTDSANRVPPLVGASVI